MSVSRPDTSDSSLHDEKIKFLNDEIETLEKAVEETKSKQEEETQKLQQMRSEERTLENRKQELQEDIDDLTARLKQFRSWREADVIIVDPPRLATGLKRNGRGFVVVAKISGQDTMASMKVARKNTANFVPADSSLASRVYDRSTLGEDLDAESTEQVAAYFKSHKFWPDVVEPGSEFVTFVELPANDARIGFYEAATEDALKIIKLDGKRRTVPKDHIVAGTAVKGRLDDLTWAIDEQRFLDSTLMQCALTLQSKPFESTAHSVVVHAYANRRPPDKAQVARPIPIFPPSDAPPLAHGLAALFNSIQSSSAAAVEQRLTQRRNAEFQKIEESIRQIEGLALDKLSTLGVVLVEPSREGRTVRKIWR